jgi:hypothetical protein
MLDSKIVEHMLEFKHLEQHTLGHRRGLQAKL